MLTDPVSLMLQKKSTTGLEAEAGDLEGAEFEVSYYDVDPQEVTNLSALKATGKAPLRTWVFKTNAKGRIQYDDSFKVSGDELYTMTDGTPSLPTGAITFKELTAPTSGKYLVNEETFFTTITGTESSQVVDLEIIIPEVPANAGLTIQKSSEDKIVEDLWFRVESDNGYSNDFATNNLGSVSVNDLQVTNNAGQLIKYTISELGFKNSDGTYSLPKRYIKTEPQTVTLDINNNVVVRFENKVIYGGINILKTSDDDIVSGLNFKIDGSDGSNRVVSTGANGTANVAGLSVYDDSNNFITYTVTELGFKNSDGTYYLPAKYVATEPQSVTLENTKVGMS